MEKNNDKELWEACEMVLNAFPEPILLVQKNLQIRFANYAAQKFFETKNFTSISFIDLITEKVEKVEKVESWLKYALRSSVMIPGKFHLVNKRMLFLESNLINFLGKQYIMLRVRRKTF